MEVATTYRNSNERMLIVSSIYSIKSDKYRASYLFYLPFAILSKLTKIYVTMSSSKCHVLVYFIQLLLYLILYIHMFEYERDFNLPAWVATWHNEFSQADLCGQVSH